MIWGGGHGPVTPLPLDPPLNRPDAINTKILLMNRELCL